MYESLLDKYNSSFDFSSLSVTVFERKLSIFRYTRVEHKYRILHNTMANNIIIIIILLLCH